MCHPRTIRIGIWLALVVPACAAGTSRAAEFKLAAASFLGGYGDADSVVGCRIQSDGTIVLAANLAPDALRGLRVAAAAGDTNNGGCVLRLSPDGQQVLSVNRLAPEARDLALDGQDSLYVALGKAGCARLTPDGLKVLWTQQLDESCDRIDAGSDGHCVVLAGKTIAIYDPAGKLLGKAPGRGFTNDVCLDSASKTVVFVGFRNARAHDGKRAEPVQISYVQALAYDGQKKWCGYDWSTDQASDRFINKPTNNMADTRGYRCSIGRDGKLYVAFESAGGNHIFRYMPNDIMAKAPLAGGDHYHQFHNSRAEHKTVFCKFEPDSGKYLQGQQFCGRLANGRANSVRMKEGEIVADEAGRVCIAGAAGVNIPLTLDPCPAEEPKGGAFALMMSPDFKTRSLCTRMQGKGGAHCADARTVKGKLMVAYAGSGAETGMHTMNPLQKEPIGKDGFFVILQSD